MRTITTTSGTAIELDGDVLAIIETVSRDLMRRAALSYTFEDVDRGHIVETLEQTRWRVSGERGAAKILGLKRTTLEARMKKLGIRAKA